MYKSLAWCEDNLIYIRVPRLSQQKVPLDTATLYSIFPVHSNSGAAPISFSQSSRYRLYSLGGGREEETDTAGGRKKGRWKETNKGDVKDQTI